TSFLPPLFTYRHFLSLWLRQRLEKTKVTVHPRLLPVLQPRFHRADSLSFGRTAEDLTATSRRLARYEALLAEILPMVSLEVRELIEDARDQDAANSNGSETNETEQGYPPVPSLQSESSTMSSTASRILLPFPVPSPLTSVSSRLSVTQGPFDPVSPPTIVSNATVPSPGAGIPSSQARLSPDALPRLPSITPDGQLIDPTRRELSPPKLHRLSDAKPEFAPDRFGISSVSPSSQILLGGLFSPPSFGRIYINTRISEYETATVSWLRPT
ncbi:uncharacterized protein A1O9_00804, partial [Exophiala aquamarina CBS 119918]